MNQILVTEKIYATPELKKKKKMYKFDFLVSIFLVCVLFSYYIYAEVDRSNKEKISHEILAGVDLKERMAQDDGEDLTTIKMEQDVLVVCLDENSEEEIPIESLCPDANDAQVGYTTVAGETYQIAAELKIPKLGIDYPVLSETNDELLKVSLTKFWGPAANEVGNFVVAGHNYRNGTMFGKLAQIEMGDKIQIVDVEGQMVEYAVYDTFYVDPDDVACTSQLTDGRREITLVTCNATGKQRLIVKAREV